MDKQDFLEVLAHQTKGIMLHTELVQLFTLIKMERCRKFQVCQLYEELKSHLETSNLYIKKFGDIPELGNIEKVHISETTISAPTLESERIALYEKAVNVWVEWEKETLELYTKISDLDSNNKYWKCKIQEVSKELERARKLQNKFTLIEKPAIKSVVVLNGTV